MKTPCRFSPTRLERGVVIRCLCEAAFDLALLAPAPVACQSRRIDGVPGRPPLAFLQERHLAAFAQRVDCVNLRAGIGWARVYGHGWRSLALRRREVARDLAVHAQIVARVGGMRRHMCVQAASFFSRRVSGLLSRAPVRARRHVLCPGRPSER